MPLFTGSEYRTIRCSHDVVGHRGSAHIPFAPGTGKQLLRRGDVHQDGCSAPLASPGARRWRPVQGWQVGDAAFQKPGTTDRAFRQELVRPALAAAIQLGSRSPAERAAASIQGRFPETRRAFCRWKQCELEGHPMSLVWSGGPLSRTSAQNSNLTQILLAARLRLSDFVPRTGALSLPQSNS